MENQLAKWISYGSHPLLIPFYASIWMITIAGFSFRDTMFRSEWAATGFVFIITVAAPLAIMYLLKRFKFIESFEVIVPGRRTLPMVLIFCWFTISLFIFRQTNYPNLFIFIILLAILAQSAALVMNIIYPASLHLTGWGAITAGMAVISQKIIINIPLTLSVCLLISGITAWGRLKLNAHNPAQVYLGWIAGVLIVLVLYLSL